MPPMTDFVSMRRAMVDSQLRTNKVTDERLLDAMAEVPRERFVPAARSGTACIDEDIPIGGGRYLLEPMIFARMVQAAEIGEDDVVLDVACGTGYSSAVLGRLARAVVAVESQPDMVATATENVAAAGLDNVMVENGAIADGWAAQAPYDAILINGAVGEVPEKILAQLADGGRLAVVARRENGPGTAELYIKVRGVVSKRVLFDANTPPLQEFASEEGFVF